MDRRLFAIDWLAVWIFFSAWCTLSGWILSLPGMLNPPGYVVSLVLFAGLSVVFNRELRTQRAHPIRWARWRRMLPAGWLLAAVLIFIGGLLYHPINYDYLSYRFPRLLHWWWEGKWTWIPSADHRMNYSAPGQEWLFAPLFVLFKTDRLFFLVNAVSYLLLPGPVFSVLTRLGLSPRIAWWWMWLLPTAYCFVLQAGGTGNDFLGALYLVAALHYALKMEGGAAGRNFTLSCCAIALMTGVKAANLPLGLPWLVVLGFGWARSRMSLRPDVIAFALVVSAIVSFLPMGALNISYTGSYTGDPHNESRMRLGSPLSGIEGNSIRLLIDNLAPPLWPTSIDCGKIVPESLKARLARDFPRVGYLTGEMQIEENAGMGLGLVLALGAMVLCRIRHGARGTASRPGVGLGLAGATLIATLAFIATMGSEAVSRLMAAYYPLYVISVLVLLGLDGAVIHRTVCRIVGAVVMLTALVLVVLNPARPLYPYGEVSTLLSALHVPASATARFNQVYETYASRWDRLKVLREALPAGTRRVGFCSADDSEVSLWLPFGSRTVVDVEPAEPRANLQAWNVSSIIVNTSIIKSTANIDLPDLLQQWNATSVFQKELLGKSQRGPETWVILQLAPP